MSSVEFAVPTASGPAGVLLHRPANARGLVGLTHGANGRPDTRDVLAATTAALDVQCAVALVLQPYRVAGRSAPPDPAVQDVAWGEVVTALRRRRGLSKVPLVLGGRSNGARLACRTALACGAAGVVALAFPVHPPGRPEKSRLDELDGAGVPVLVLQGDRDTFGMPPAGPQRDVVVLPRDGHGLSKNLPTIAAEVSRFLSDLLGTAAA